MAKYESPRYKELGFYVDGTFRKFSGGFYSTDESDEIAVLDGISDVIRIDEVEPEVVPEELSETAEIASEETPKAPAKGRKPSAK